MVGVAEGRAQQRHERPEALAPGFHQMRGGLGDERVVALDGLVQARFDTLEAQLQSVAQTRVGEESQIRQPFPPYLMNVEAL